MKASFVYFVTKNLAYICNNRFFELIFRFKVFFGGEQGYSENRRHFDF